MTEFVSESIRPRAGSFDAAAMGRGEPGLPDAFEWRGTWYEVVERLAQWKETAPEGGKPGGEVYLRRHCYRLGMSDGSMWTVYCLRQPPKRRWFLYSVERTRE